MKNLEQCSPEKLAYWYFRLNGFLTIPNFVVHLEESFHKQGRRQATDVDVLGVRFPFRKELPEEKEPMKDDEKWTNKNKITFVLAEVKTGHKVQFNESWSNSEYIKRILYCIGALKDDSEIEKCAELLTKDGFYENNDFCFHFCLICQETNQNLSQKKAILITWKEIAKFIYERFRKYHLQKSSHPQWDNCGDKLFKLAISSKNFDDFILKLKISFQLK